MMCFPGKSLVMDLMEWLFLSREQRGSPQSPTDEGDPMTLFPVAQIVEQGASNAKIMGSIPRENKSW